MNITGHFHSGEMALQMMNLLMHQRFKETHVNEFGEYDMAGGGIKDNPEPISTERFVEYFHSRLQVIDKALDEIKAKHPAAEHYLRQLSNHHYSMSCSDGAYKTIDMLEMGVGEILGAWQNAGVVKEVDGGWVLDVDRMNKIGYEECIIKEMDL